MTPLERWHNYMHTQDPADLDAALAENCVFHSPVVHTPQQGKKITFLYLSAAAKVFGETFRYVREFGTGHQVALEFECEVDGIHINGIDMIELDETGHITDFKVMIRPLKAVNTLHAAMGKMLEELKNGA